jgi:hypothetical protein
LVVFPSLDNEEVKQIADAAEISPKRVKELHKKWLEFAGTCSAWSSGVV